MKELPRRTAAEAAELIPPGATVAMSGYAMAGYPKAVVTALAERRRGGEHLNLRLLTGANVPWLDDTLAGAEALGWRAPMCASRTLASQINAGRVQYVEQQMCKMPRLLRRRAFGSIDYAVVEALGFDSEGRIIPTSSVGLTHYLVEAADSVIVEINAAQPLILGRLHDVYIPARPPATRPIPLTGVTDRIGESAIPVDRSKIVAVVGTEIPERLGTQPKGNEITDRIADHLFNFLEGEYRETGGILPPIQTGFGGIADSIATAFHRSAFRDLAFFCGGITEPVMELLAAGKAISLSAGGLGMSERVEEILRSVAGIEKHLVLRSGDVTNNSEVIGRLALIALNTGIEIDVYGNVNSSHIGGNRVVNGIGGGANFAQNAGLSVVLIPSTAKGGAISSIVPQVSHVDIGEHDVDIVVTEHGVADLRGLDENERADAIVTRCTGEYQDQLGAYLADARKSAGGHHPQLPAEARQWYKRLKETGSMKESNR